MSTELTIVYVSTCLRNSSATTIANQCVPFTFFIFYIYIFFFGRCPAANNFHMSVLNIFGNILPRYIESGIVQ